MALGTDLLVDKSNLAFAIDVESPTFWNCTRTVDDAVRFCNLFAGIAENGVVELERFGISLVGGSIVAAGRKECDIELV